MQDENPEVRRATARALGQIGGETAISVLVKTLHDKDSDVRQMVVSALCQIGGSTVVSILINTLRHTDSTMRQVAAEALGKTGNEVLVSTLIDILHDVDNSVRRTAVLALDQIGSELAVSALVNSLCDTDSGVRKAIVQALSKFSGEGSKLAISALVNSLRDVDSGVRRAAAQALGKYSDKVTITALTNALNDKDSWVREAAASALGQIGDRTVVDILIAALSDVESGVREATTSALGRIGSETVVNNLINALHDINSSVRESATWALGRIGGKTVVSTLLDTLHNEEDSWVYWPAIMVLKRIGDPSLLIELVLNFRQNVQTKPEILHIIIALQERFKIYRTDFFWSPSSVKQRPPAEKIMCSLRVVLASPSDVQPERDVLPNVIDELNRSMGAVLNVDLKLYRWETDTYPGFHSEGPQGLIDDILRIDDCDVLIGIFWKRFGKPTKSAGSGTEHEFLTAYKAWEKNKRPQIMMYFKDAPYSPKAREETEQWGKVLDFKANFPEEGLWWPFPETGAFKDLVRTHLSGWLRDNFKK